jgi:hypothetical protein
MYATNEDKQLHKMMLEHDMAIRRAKGFIEFMRLVCRNEAHFLRDLRIQGGNDARLSVQNDNAHRCH